MPVLDAIGRLVGLQAPALARGRQAAFGKQTAGLDLDELVVRSRALLAGRTLTRPRLGAALASWWPEYDPLALAWSAQMLVPVVHPPPNGTWRRGGATFERLPRASRAEVEALRLLDFAAGGLSRDLVWS